MTNAIRNGLIGVALMLIILSIYFLNVTQQDNITTAPTLSRFEVASRLQRKILDKIERVEYGTLTTKDLDKQLPPIKKSLDSIKTLLTYSEASRLEILYKEESQEMVTRIIEYQETN